MPDHDAFTQIVERDLKGKATPEDRAQLEASPNDWDESLSVLYTEAITQLSVLKLRKLEEQQKYLAKGPEAKSAWFAREVEIDRKKVMTKKFSQHVAAKRIEVKRLIRQAHMAAHTARGGTQLSAVPSSPIPAIIDADLMFPSATRELLDMLLHTKKPKEHIDMFLAAFVVRAIELYDEHGPDEEEILDKVSRVEPERIMDFWHPDELEGLA